VRFSAATTAGRFLPQRLALRVEPLLGRIDAVLFTADERGEAGRMSVIAFSIRIISAVIAFVSQVLMARWMGSFEYGIFVLVWVTMVIVGNLACLGFHTSVIRFIPEYRERGLMDEPVGYYTLDTVHEWRDRLGMHVVEGHDQNHYTLMLRDDGAALVARELLRSLPG